MPYAELKGLRVFYEAAGEGERTLVCLHGISSNSRSWRNQLAALSGRYRVIAWDAPGYGKSDDPPGPFLMADFADALASLLDMEGLEKAVIVGLSMGGVLAQEFYRRHPGRVRALVLADTNTGGGARPEAERKTRLETRLRAIATLNPAEIAAQRAPALLSPLAPPPLLDEVVAMVSEIHPAGYRNAAIALNEADTREVLPEVQVPALVIWGEFDKVTLLSEAQALQSAIPGARLVTIEGAGHLSNLEQPERFNRAVVSFLEGLPLP